MSSFFGKNLTCRIICDTILVSKLKELRYEQFTDQKSRNS